MYGSAVARDERDGDVLNMMIKIFSRRIKWRCRKRNLRFFPTLRFAPAE
jgi:hypothetical protein